MSNQEGAGERGHARSLAKAYITWNASDEVCLSVMDSCIYTFDPNSHVGYSLKSHPADW